MAPSVLSHKGDHRERYRVLALLIVSHLLDPASAENVSEAVSEAVTDPSSDRAVTTSSRAVVSLWCNDN